MKLDEASRVGTQKVAIISGDPGVTEDALNDLLEFFTPIVWNVSTVKDEVVVTVVLLNNSYVRRAQLAMPVVGPGGRIQ